MATVTARDAVPVGDESLLNANPTRDHDKNVLRVQRNAQWRAQRFQPKCDPVVCDPVVCELLRVLGSADVKQKFLNEGTETVGNTPAEFAALIKFDREKLGKVIRDAGIRAN